MVALKGSGLALPRAPLEDWLRDYYFMAEIDISSSGVQPYSMTELRDKAGVTNAEIDSLVFADGYSLGFPEVRAAIAQRWAGGEAEKVMTSSGSSEAISLVMMALLRPGDEVIVVKPGYHLLTEFPAALGCITKTWRLSAENDWKPSLDDLAELITPRTRAIIVNFPQNPTGVSIVEGDLRRLLRLAEEVDAYILWDGAFAELTYETDPLPNVPQIYPRGISFGTFSKMFGLPGLRFGWCIAPPDVLAECVRIRDYNTLHVSPLIELLALRVLQKADSFVVPRLEQAKHNRTILSDWTSGLDGRVSLTLPDGGVAAFPRLNGLANTSDFCEILFRKYGVLVVPGECFGVPQNIRLGFGGGTDELSRGLDRLGSALSSDAVLES